MIELQILQYSYWEHFKHAKDLSLILPIGHSHRVEIETELEKLRLKINEQKPEA